MADRRAVLLGTALVTLIMVLSSMGLLVVLAPSAGTHASPLAISATTAKSAAGTGGISPPAKSLGTLDSPLNVASTGTSTSPIGQHALAVAQAAGVSPRDVFVPRAGATPAQQAQAVQAGHVTPLYGQYSPAPIGLADYGLTANPNGNGSVVASILNTSSVFATVDQNGTGIVSAYPFSSSPDLYGIQLNAVSTSINLFGNNSYSFWTQNVAEYSPVQQELVLVTNVWNFTGPSLSSNVFAAHGPYGNQVGNVFYYAEYFVSGVTAPFNLGLYMNNSLNASRNQVSFTVTLTDPGNPSVNGAYPYDWVVFNSVAATPSNYTANGFQYNPFGLTNDFELIFGGPGGGSTADLYSANANLTLQYWNATMGAYESVPSAYSYGGETGETVTGAYVGWQNNTTTGAPYGVLTTGPGILEGLWNATGQAGLDPLSLAITPTNAFYFIGPNWTSNFSYQGDPYWAPQEMTGGLFMLAPGNYTLVIALSYYDEVLTQFTLGAGGITITYSLTADSSVGIYTPLYFWDNSQFGPLSTGGSGTPASPYEIDNSQTFAFPTVFGLFNDYTFPIFTGVFVWGTTASVSFSGMPALTTGSPYTYFPATNDLGYVFYNAANASLVNSTQISGWFTSNVDAGIGYGFYGNYYGTYSVLEWNSTNLLIANDTFQTQAAGLYLSLGFNNTIWGNTFEMVANPTFAACAIFGICPLNLSVGVQAAEGGDLIYNNAFYTTITAVEPPFDMYNGDYVPWQNTWNITPTARATVNYAPNWPDFALTGTIIGNATQGGNFWWDYGYVPNLYGVLPYNESQLGIPYGQIYAGGDSYPLVLTTYTVTFTESGLPSGSLWSVSVNSTVLYSTTTTIAFLEANGSFTYTVGSVAGWSPSLGTGTIVVAGSPLSVTVTFTAVLYAVTFFESGLPSGTQWSVTVNSASPTSTTNTLIVDLANGSYPYTVATTSSGWTPLPSSGTVVVSGAAQQVNTTYSPPPPPTYTVTFTESGLTSGTSWAVTLNSVQHTSTTTTVTFTEASGTYSYTFGAVAGYTTPAGGMVTVNGADTGVSATYTATVTPTYTLSFSESGLPTSSNWSVTLQGGSPTFSDGASTIAFVGLVNAGYSYTIGSFAGYTANVTSGMATVSGADVSVLIGFTAVGPATYSVTFTESGLPSGTSWSVTLGSTTMTGTAGSSIVFTGIANGAHPFTVGAVSGYSSSTSSSSVTVAGSSQTVAVTFSTSSTSTSNSGLSTLDWAIIGAVIAIIIIALLVMLAMRGRSGGKSPNSQDETSTQGDSGTDDGSSGGGQA